MQIGLVQLLVVMELLVTEISVKVCAGSHHIFFTENFENMRWAKII
jgi:hypothetical protein